jgi:hypothetical protein
VEGVRASDFSAMKCARPSYCFGRREAASPWSKLGAPVCVGLRAAILRFAAVLRVRAGLTLGACNSAEMPRSVVHTSRNAEIEIGPHLSLRRSPHLSRECRLGLLARLVLRLRVRPGSFRGGAPGRACAEPATAAAHEDEEALAVAKEHRGQGVWLSPASVLAAAELRRPRSAPFSRDFFPNIGLSSL